jgi:hypothetical protein
MKAIQGAWLLVAVGLVACHGNGSTGVREGGLDGDLVIEPGREFTLAVGETANIRGTELLVHFVGVGEDSRCPVDVQCPWQGDAEVRLELSSRNAEFAPQSRTLHSGVEPHETSFMGVTIRLVDVRPDPRAAGPPISPGSYTVELVAQR